MRIGIGFDIHRLVAGRPFIIAGVKIPFDRGPLGHSDGDVLCHAMADAMLGAMALGDIGLHFPDTDPRWKGIPGLQILKTVRQKVEKGGWKVKQIDAILLCEKPSLSPFREEIQKNICRALKIARSQTGIKFKTAEGLAEIGKSRAISSFAVVNLEPK